MSFWVNPTSLSADYQGLPNRYAGNANDGSFGVFLRSSGKIAFYTANGNYDPGSHILSTGTWAHICVTFDGTQGAGACPGFGYVNGVQDGTFTTGSQLASNAAIHFKVGLDSGGNSHLNGSVADVALWSVILTGSEINALAAGARPNRIRRSSLVAYLPLDGLQSTEPDLSGNVNNGTLIGTSTATGPPVALFTPRGPQSTFPFDAPLVTFVTNTSKIQLPINCVVVSNQPEEKKSRFVTDFTGILKNIFREE